MQEYPHVYKVSAIAANAGNVQLSSPGLEPITTAAPAEFDGPGDLWSPETLFAGSVADCYILSFRAVTNAKKFDWINLECQTDAVLERPERQTQFTQLNLRVKLTVARGTNIELAEKLLMRAKDICLVTNSMTAEKTLDIQIIEVD
ncbi:MAG: OsmC family protein [Gammaproteobacteria bacterium]|nr:OsmC family protein [Gammaproteobacteria bacterium]